MIYQVVNIVYLISVLFAGICGLYRYKLLDPGSKVLCILMCCAFINESAASYLAIRYHNNLQLYTIYSFLEFFLICLYLNKVVDVFVRRGFGLYIAAGGIILGILNLLFVQHIDSINSYFLLLEGLLVIGMCLFAFFRFLLKKDWLTLHKYHHFWFISILMFFWSITFLTWGLYDYINQTFFQSARNMNIALATVSTITYGCFGSIFLMYPKMKRN